MDIGVHRCTASHPPTHSVCGCSLVTALESLLAVGKTLSAWFVPFPSFEVRLDFIFRAERGEAVYLSTQMVFLFKSCQSKPHSALSLCPASGGGG